MWLIVNDMFNAYGITLLSCAPIFAFEKNGYSKCKHIILALLALSFWILLTISTISSIIFIGTLAIVIFTLVKFLAGGRNHGWAKPSNSMLW